MIGYILQRLAMTIPVLIMSTVAIFMMMHMSGGDPARMMLGEDADEKTVLLLTQELGLDRPIYVQYLDWISRAARGDLGRSLTSLRIPVFEAVSARIPVTLELALLSTIVALTIAIPVGIIAAMRRDSPADLGTTVFAMFGLAVPQFVMAIALVLLFAVFLRWLPPSGFVPLDKDILANLRHMILPSITMGTAYAAVVMRMMRSSLLEVLSQEYIRTAYSKGLAPRPVLTRHALKNASIPVVTIVGLQLGHLMAGSIVTETVFALPGLGKLAIDSVLSRDFIMVQGVALVMVTGYVLMNLIVDVLYGYLDPRIKYR